jgi:two-component system cell cycle response regulator DivK
LVATSVPTIEESGVMNNSSNVVLVIEDTESSMKLFEHVLELHGYNTLQAKDGIRGWELAREHRPDLILMDIQLPEVSGLEVTKWLKDDESLKSIPIIAVTAFALEGDEEKMLNGGCDAYISKPISVPKLLQTIQRLVAEKGINPAPECVPARLPVIYQALRMPQS